MSLEKRIEEILEGYRKGEIDAAGAREMLRLCVYESLGFATIDHNRHIRHGIPEVVYGEGKTEEEVVAIASRIYEASGRVLVTRLSPRKAELLLERYPEARYHARGRLLTVGSPVPPPEGAREVVVISAGTSDRGVAEEAAVTAEFFGNPVSRITDVGVAGIHRLAEKMEVIDRAGIAIVVAGMEGALPSVVAGMSGKPVVAVPTSVGYGASFGGIAPLLGMLNSCAPGVVVVNIDNGFGAAYFATILNRWWGEKKGREEER
ncbi:MAG: nickel pincer cofactor biosynthesis protein LarB [Deltaproteobacteria bacterium]|nr:MAG: nickel pincer cofactor biosynthesis protein LarB [Deltaproteobacteria bacterium]